MHGDPTYLNAANERVAAYVKTTSRKTKEGTEVRYLHLARNQWDPARRRSVPQVLFSFGREDARHHR